MIKSPFYTFLLVSMITISSPVLATPETEMKQAPIVQQQLEPADIIGFRSAHFGMKQDQVMLAIEKDFGLKKDQVQTGKNMVTRTDSLAITVNDLLPNTGKAFISYIFGYESNGLIQINIVWNSTEDKKQTPETILGLAGSLQNHFLKQNFQADKVSTGIRLDQDTVLLLRATDKDKQAVGLILDEIGKGQDNVETKDLLLKLSYQDSPDAPDIYHVPEGAF